MRSPPGAPRGVPVDDAGFIITCYVLTLGALFTYAWFLARRARRTGRTADAEELPWT